MSSSVVAIDRRATVSHLLEVRNRLVCLPGRAILQRPTIKNAVILSGGEPTDFFPQKIYPSRSRRTCLQIAKYSDCEEGILSE
jgi:hypothetical protein